MSSPDARPAGASQPGQPEGTTSSGPLRAPTGPGGDPAVTWPSAPQPPRMSRPSRPTAGPSESQIATEPEIPATAVQAPPDAGRPPVWGAAVDRVRRVDRRRTYIVAGSAAALLAACLICGLTRDYWGGLVAGLFEQPTGTTGPAGPTVPGCDFATTPQDAARLYGGDSSRWQAIDTNGDGKPDGWHYLPGNATQINPEGCVMEGYFGNSNGTTSSFDSRSTQTIQGGTIWNSTDLDHLHQQNGYPEK